MDIRQITTFRKVVETGSVTLAAKELNYAQPTVTLHIHELEAQLQVQLFNRVGRRLLLTDAGRELYSLSRDMEQILKKIAEIGENAGTVRGTLRIAVAPANLRYMFFDVVTRFLREHPNADVKIINDHSVQKIYEQLCNGTVDFVILTGSWQSGDNVTIELLRTCEHVLVTGPQVDQSKLNLTESGQPLGCKLISNHYMSFSRQQIEQYLHARNISPDGYIEAWDVDTIKKFTEQNLGIALLPRFVVEEELARGSIVTVPLDTRLDDYRVFLAYLKNNWQPPLAREFREAMMELKGK